MELMPRRSRRRALAKAAFALTVFAVASAGSAGDGSSPGYRPQGATSNGLLVMSYNIKGMPWPVATGREKALSLIGQRLATMRAVGSQPHVVMLQEAFTGEAKQIGRAAGYRYAVGGPDAAQVNPASAPADMASFARQASWLKGETEGKWLDSGLLILSDYPVVAVRRLAFPQYACAGYDCLANKGAVIAWIAVPGSPTPVAFVNTHLNARGASGVADARSDRAYALQVRLLRDFVASALPEGSPAIMGGDFNNGKVPDRRAVTRDPLLPGAGNAILTAMEKTGAVPTRDRADVQAILRKGKDWLYYRSGNRTDLELSGFSVPFGTERDGTSLSDHMGYVVRYRLDAVTPASPPSRGNVI